MTPSPKPITGCTECDAYLRQYGPHIVAACASVGIEAKRSTPDMVRSHMAAVHAEHTPRP